MADTEIGSIVPETPLKDDLVPIARPGDVTARATTIEEIINSQVGGDASSNTPDQDTLGMTLGLNNVAGWGGVAIGLNNSAAGTAYQSGAVAIGEGNTVLTGHAFGRGNTINNDAFVLGDSSEATGTESMAIGYRNTAGHEQAVVIGIEGVSRLYREHVEAFGSAYGYLTRHLLSKVTTDATPIALNLSSSGYKLTIRQDTVYVFTVRVTATTVDAGVAAAWILSGAIKNAGGTVTLLGAIATTFSGADAGASGWAAAVTANDTDKCLEITVTGAAGVSVEWYAVVEGLEHWRT